jgi:LysM repeat protein
MYRYLLRPFGFIPALPLFLILLLGTPPFGGSACSAKTPSIHDSIDKPDYISRQIQYRRKYSFIHYRENTIEWRDYAAVHQFFYALRNAQNRKVKVVHIGDSHVQADIVTGHLRNRFQDIFGNGGRGMVFPYAAANTHPGYDYYTYARGRWDYVRNINPNPHLDLGTSGVTIRTRDVNAGFRIAFNKFYREMNNTVLKVYCKPSDFAFDLVLRINNQKTVIQPTIQGANLPYIQFNLPKDAKVIDISLANNSGTKQFFDCYGVSLEQPESQGVLYHSVGINGANFSSVLRQQRMVSELQEMNPDLVVIDLSGNEYYSRGLNPAEFEAKLSHVIDWVRQSTASASILITCSQDIYRYTTQNIADCGPAAEIAKRVALSRNCAFYDYYRVSGGRYAMQKWYNYHLAKSDKVHLTYEGYLTKGELMLNGLLNGYLHVLKGNLHPPTNVDSVPVIAKPYTPAATPVLAQTHSYSVQEKRTPIATTPQKAAQKIHYRVQPGDVLGKIAEQHNVSVGELMRWNGLASSFIRVGQPLIVYTPATYNQRPATAALSPNTKSTTVKAKATPIGTPQAKSKDGEMMANANSKGSAKQPNNEANMPDSNSSSVLAKFKKKKGKLTHAVQSGDNLWLIARKYSITVDDIIAANRLTTDKLKPGMVLVIPQPHISNP